MSESLRWPDERERGVPSLRLVGEGQRISGGPSLTVGEADAEFGLLEAERDHEGHTSFMGLAHDRRGAVALEAEHLLEDPGHEGHGGDRVVVEKHLVAGSEAGPLNGLDDRDSWTWAGGIAHLTVIARGGPSGLPLPTRRLRSPR
jgi:hypothetical protein